MYLQKNLVILAVTVSLEMNIVPHKDLELKNEKTVRPVLAKVPTHQVSSELVQPLSFVPMTMDDDDGRRRRTNDYD